MTENRETFFARLKEPAVAALFSSEDIARIELAYDLSKYAHRGQERKDGERYFEHPRRVAIRLIEALKIREPAVIIAALLHDAYEDSARYMTPEKVRIIGGNEAERMIRLLSKLPETKAHYLENLERHGDWKTLAVKLEDRLDNMMTLRETEPAFQAKQVRETREKYVPLFDRLVTLAPPSHAEAVRSEIDLLLTVTDMYDPELRAQQLAMIKAEDT